MTVKFRVDIPIRHEKTGATGHQFFVVSADASREAREIALVEARDADAVRHRGGAELMVSDPLVLDVHEI